MKIILIKPLSFDGNLKTKILSLINRILFIAIITISTNFANAQVSSSDRFKFGQNLEIRRELNVGFSLIPSQRLSVPFGNFVYNGVRMVSFKFISNAYPEVKITLVEGFFSTIGLDKKVFDKFIYQIFLYDQAEKKLRFY